MASIPLPVEARAPQPGLRAWIIYNELPEGCIAFEVTDNGAEPHLHRSEFAVIDVSDREPMQGEMFLIQWNGGSRQIVDARLIAGRYGSGPNNTMIDTSLWWVGWQSAMYRLDGTVAHVGRWHDGPYDDEHLRSKLVGKVVGIYQPDFMAAMVRSAA